MVPAHASRHSTDPATGLKAFNTRAAKASARIAGQGYAAATAETQTELPPPPPGASFNAVEQEKYRQFKEARRGAADYMAMEGEFRRYLEDVYSTQPVARDALSDDCEVLVVGAGFAGWCCGTSCRPPGSAMCAFAKRPVTLAAPGIGIAIPASPAASRPIAICAA